MKSLARQQRHRRVRTRITGTADRPRLVVFRGAKTMTAQLVDDTKHTVLLTVTTPAGNVATVKEAAGLGERLAKAAKAKKLTRAVFDRAGYQYHGKVRALAEAARQGGLEF